MGQRMRRFRDAITGMFTTRQHAEANPAITVSETVRPKCRVGVTTGPTSGLPLAAASAARNAAMQLQKAARLPGTATETVQFGRDLLVRVTVEVLTDTE